MSTPSVMLKARSHLSAWAAEELRPGVLASGLLAGGLIYLLEVVFAISFTALVYTNELSNYLPLAIGFTLIGDVILVVCVVVFSSYRGASAIEQDVPAAILALTVAAVLGTLPAGTDPATKFATVVMVVVLTTTLTGLFFLLTGYFKWGGLARFLPYPVMGGFLAGTGWLLLTGALGLATDRPLSIELLEGGLVVKWLPALIFGVVLLTANRRWRSPLIVPAIIVGGVILFYLVVGLSNSPIDQLRVDGWLLAEVPAGGAWHFPLNADLLSQVNWSALSGQLVTIAPILLISVVALLLNVNALELISKRDIDLNHELIVAGAGNVLAGLVGGLPGYADITFSTLNLRLTGGRRVTLLITAALLALTVFAGAAFLVAVPKFVLAGVIFYIGLDLLITWTYEAWFKFPRVDFAIILSILAVIALRGFLEGVLVGLVAAIVLFVINYSRTSMIKHALSGVNFRSRVNRSFSQRAVLDAHGAQLYVLELQGFIFFGTANGLYEQIKLRVRDATQPAVQFVVLDFAHVTGLDSTGLLSFEKLLSLVKEKSFTLVLTGLSGRSIQHTLLREQLRRGGFDEETNTLHFFFDLDRGLEWCEDQLIAAAQLEAEEKTLTDYFDHILPVDQMSRIMRYLERREFTAGEYLMRQGEAADDLFFIESGQVTSQIEHPDQQPIRLETMCGGRTVGELGFYLGTPRSAAVIADEASITYRLTRRALERMEQADPPAALAFHRLIVHLLGDRTIHLMRSVQALQR